MMQSFFILGHCLHKKIRDPIGCGCLEYRSSDIMTTLLGRVTSFSHFFSLLSEENFISIASHDMSKTLKFTLHNCHTIKIGVGPGNFERVNSFLVIVSTLVAIDGLFSE